MILEKEITIVQDQLSSSEKRIIKEVVRGCSNIELEKNEEAIRQYHSERYVNTHSKMVNMNKKCGIGKVTKIGYV